MLAWGQPARLGSHTARRFSEPTTAGAAPAESRRQSHEDDRRGQVGVVGNHGLAAAQLRTPVVEIGEFRHTGASQRLPPASCCRFSAQTNSAVCGDARNTQRREPIHAALHRRVGPAQFGSQVIEGCRRVGPAAADGGRTGADRDCAESYVA